MANVQLQNGYIKIANDLFEQLIIRKFSSKQLRILNLLLRCSYGFNSKTAIISPLNMFAAAHIYKGDVKRELKKLEEQAIIVCNFENNTYSVNKNYDEWKIPFHKLFDDGKFKELKNKQYDKKSSRTTNQEVSAELTDKNNGSRTTNQEVSAELTDKLVEHELLSPENNQYYEVLAQPKDIKDIKDNIYIIKDIYNDPKIIEFRKSYMEVLKKPFRINVDERKKLVETLNELSMQGFKFEDVSKEFFENFKKIDFSKINFDPSIHWALKDNNFLSVLDGEFTNKKKEEWNADDFYYN